MRRRIVSTATGIALAVAAVGLTGCAEPSPAQPTPTTAETTASPTPPPTPTPTPTPSPTETTPPAPAPFDAATIIDAVIAKDADAVIGQLGDPIREIDTIAGTYASVSAATAAADLAVVLTIGETFKPGQDADYAALASSSHPEFGGGDAVVLAGSQGTLLSFLPGAYLRTAA